MIVKNTIYLTTLLLLLSSAKCSDDNNMTNPNGVLHILPNDYIGRVVIIYNQKNGVTQKIIDGKRVYEIPSCCILKTQFTRPSGSINIPEEKYFTYIYANGDTIPYLSNRDFIDSNRLNEIFSFSHGIGGIGFDENEDYEISDYVIDTLKNVGKYSGLPFSKSDLQKCH